MARVTIEDCLENVENQFELVLLAAKRAHQLAKGQESTLPEEKDKLEDKPTVIALREIALGKFLPNTDTETVEQSQKIQSFSTESESESESETNPNE